MAISSVCSGFVHLVRVVAFLTEWTTQVIVDVVTYLFATAIVRGPGKSAAVPQLVEFNRLTFFDQVARVVLQIAWVVRPSAALSTFRAVEQRKFLVRATNSGVSAIIDPLGKIIQRTDSFEEDVLIGQVKPMTSITFYQRFGNWFPVLMVMTLGAIIYTKSSRRKLNRS